MRKSKQKKPRFDGSYARSKKKDRPFRVKLIAGEVPREEKGREDIVLENKTYKYTISRFSSSPDAKKEYLRQIKEIKNKISILENTFSPKEAYLIARDIGLVQNIKALKSKYRMGYYRTRLERKHKNPAMIPTPADNKLEDYEIVSKHKLCTIDDLSHGRRVIRARRQNLKSPDDGIFRPRIGGVDVPVWRSEGVYLQPGAFLLAQDYKRVKVVFDPKKPKTKHRYLGVELEFCCKLKKEALAIKIQEAGLSAYCELKQDQSLRPKEGEYGHELALLAPEKKMLTVVRKVCRLLEKEGAVTKDRRCGMHVHIDVRHRDKDTVFSNLVACQRILMLMNSKKRRDGEFCKRVKSRRFPKRFDGGYRERYKTINASSYYRHKTIEVRVHDGTVDYKDISNWLKLLIKIANYKERVSRPIFGIKKLGEVFSLDNKTKEYVKDKINYWRVNREQSTQLIGISTLVNRVN